MMKQFVKNGKVILYFFFVILVAVITIYLIFDLYQNWFWHTSFTNVNVNFSIIYTCITPEVNIAIDIESMTTKDLVEYLRKLPKDTDVVIPVHLIAKILIELPEDILREFLARSLEPMEASKIKDILMNIPPERWMRRFYLEKIPAYVILADILMTLPKEQLLMIMTRSLQPVPALIFADIMDLISGEDFNIQFSAGLVKEITSTLPAEIFVKGKPEIIYDGAAAMKAWKSLTKVKKKTFKHKRYDQVFKSKF